MGFYIDPNGNYYSGDQVVGDNSIEVPERPSPKHFWANGAWELDVARFQHEQGKIPTDVFIDTVFAPPSGAPADYSWNRFSLVMKAVPALVHKLPKGGFVAGTRLEIMALADWLLKHDANWAEVATPGEGSIISMQEFEAVIGLLDAYNVQ